MTFRKSLAAMAVVGCSFAGLVGTLASAPAAGADDCASPQGMRRLGRPATHGYLQRGARR